MRSVSESERAVLALCLQHPEAFRRATAQTTPEHYEGENRSLFLAMQCVGEPLDVSRLADELGKNAGNRQKLYARVSALKFYVADLGNITALIDELHDAYLVRAMNATLQRAMAEVQRSDAPARNLAERIRGEVLEVLDSAGASGYAIPTEVALASAYVEAQRAADLGGFPGYPTGLSPIDGLIGGFGLGHVTTIMGEPGVGKTALMLQAALSIACQTPVAIASLEMDPADLTQRIQASLSNVPYSRIRSGLLNDGEREAVSAVDDTIVSSRLFFAPPHIQTFDEVSRFFRYMHFEHGCRVCFLDNILSLDYEGRLEHDHLTRVANGSQRLANELQLALVNLHHTNTDERPTLRNAYGAKAVIRHSSNVLALYQEDPLRSRIEAIELKGRTSGKGNRFMVFEGAYQRFRSWNAIYD